MQSPNENRSGIAALKGRLSLPVIGAPMFLASGVDLVVAQCCAGIVGTFPSLNARSPAALGAWLDEIETRLAAFAAETGREPAPYGVNLIVHEVNPRLDEDLAVCVRHRVPIVITSLSAPDRVVEAVRPHGGLVFHDVAHVAHARRAARAGVDGLILVCAGAGGHGGMLSPFAFVEEVRAFWDGPLLLSGAIANGRAILAAEVLGCDLAYCGTVFLPAREAMAPQGHKEMVVASGAQDILLTPAVSGTHANFLVPSLVAAGIDPKEAAFARPRRMTGGADGESRAWRDIWSAGQAVGQSADIQPVAAIVARLAEEYRAARAGVAPPG